jgi:hypothetical protein
MTSFRRGICEWLARDMRIVVDRMTDLVNHGYAPALERPQEMADRLLSAVRQKNRTGGESLGQPADFGNSGSNSAAAALQPTSDEADKEAYS